MMAANCVGLSRGPICYCGPGEWFIIQYSGVWLDRACQDFTDVCYCRVNLKIWMFYAKSAVWFAARHCSQMRQDVLCSRTHWKAERGNSMQKVYRVYSYPPRSFTVCHPVIHKAKILALWPCDSGQFTHIKTQTESPSMQTRTHTLSLTSLLIAQEILSALGQLQAH